MPDPISERLSRFTPETGLDRDALLFRAGQLSARPGRVWKLLAAALALSQALTLVLLWPRTPGPTPAPAPDPPAQARPQPPEAPADPGPYPVEEKLPALTAVEGLVPDAPPLRAFGAPPADVY